MDKAYKTNAYSDGKKRMFSIPKIAYLDSLGFEIVEYGVCDESGHAWVRFPETDEVANALKEYGGNEAMKRYNNSFVKIERFLFALKRKHQENK